MRKRIRHYLDSAGRRAGRPARYVRERKKRFIALVVVLFQVAGALTSIEAVMAPRSSQGAIAWAVSLNTMPYVAVPLYWLVGNPSFDGYETKRRSTHDDTSPIVSLAVSRLREGGFVTYGHDRHRFKERMANLPPVSGNAVELLRDGEAIFESVIDGIRKAETYVLVQFYIVRDDGLGRRLQEAMIETAARGVRVYFMYDGVGSYQLPRSYLSRLRDAGVEVGGFNNLRGLLRRFQVNFRNHRKVVVVDGRHAWVGGVNVGDEYLGLNQRLNPWRDIMVKVTGPAAQLAQVPFLEDWHWTRGAVLDLDWTPRAAGAGHDLTVFCLPTGPSDPFETCALYFLSSINHASTRLWIASPYFVPDEQIVSALKLAALRGVDVRILLPEDCDNPLVRWSGWSYVGPLEEAGVKVYRHMDGFLHYKAMLIDDDFAAVGTANFDNRSFRLNFEITMEVHDRAFAQKLEAIFLDDFSGSRLASAAELEARSFPVRLAVRVARLLSPLQ